MTGRAWQRFLGHHAAVASVFLLALPVMLFVSLMLLACMGPPVFFVQERPGLGGAPFRLPDHGALRQ